DPPSASKPPAVSNQATLSDSASVSDPAPISEPASVSTPAVVSEQAPISNVVAAVTDVIAWVQNMFASVFGAVVPLTPLPGDLYSFLLGLTGTVPEENGSGRIDGSGWSASADTSVASQMRLVPLLSGVPVPLAAKIEAATLGGIAASIFNTMSEAAIFNTMSE